LYSFMGLDISIPNSRLFTCCRHINLRRLFANFSRIDDEFEGIGVLILFHQLQVGEPLSAFERIAARKTLLLRIRSAAISYFPSAPRWSAALTICASERPR